MLFCDLRRYCARRSAIAVLPLFVALTVAWPHDGPAQAGTETVRREFLAAPAAEHRLLRLESRHRHMPLSFELNRGQAATSVRYLARGSGFTLFLTATEAVLVSRSPHSSRSSVVSNVLTLRLAGSNPAARLSGLDALPGQANYLLGRDRSRWVTDVPTYAKVKCESVYPGVDLVYYGTEERLEDDFTVAPGSDPRVIRLSLPGAAARVDGDGDLVAKVGSDEIRLGRPVAYQTSAGEGHRMSVKAEYVQITPSEFGFRLGTYDHHRALVIDPVLMYSTYLGGTNLDKATSIALDASGSAYVTGNTTSTDFPVFPKPGAFQTACTLNAQSVCAGDIFVTKLNASGTVVYSTYVGGSGGDFGLGIAVDPAGNAYVAGQTTSKDFPIPAGVNTFQSSCGLDSSGNCQDGFLLVLNSSGSALVYSTYLGGSNNDEANAVTVDTAGDAYVVGQTSSSNFPVSSGAFQTHCGTDGTCNASSGTPAADAFVTKLNTTKSGSASLAYSTYLGGSGSDIAFAVAVDAAGHAVVTGSTKSATSFPTTPAAFQTACKTSGGTCNGNAFVTELKADGSGLVYSTYLGGSGTTGFGDSGAGIALDAAGDAYVVGQTASADFPVTSGAYKTTCGTDKNCNPAGNPAVNTPDVFVTELNSSGSGLVYSTYLGGSGTDLAGGIALGPGNVAYVTGTTNSSDFPIVDAYPQGKTFGGGVCSGAPCQDAFVAELDASGSSLLFSAYLGGDNADFGAGVAVDPSGNAYVAGSTQTPNVDPVPFPTTTGAFQTTYKGNTDAFVTAIGSTTTPFVRLSPTSLAFTNQFVGTTGTQTVTLTNTGSATLSISGMAITGSNAGAFTETNGCGNSVAAGSNCAISVNFQPSAPGVASATLTVNDNAANSPQSIPLTGTGIAPVVSLSSTTVDFGSQIVGTAGSPKILTISNTGNTTLSITSVAISGDFSIQSNACGSSVAAGGNCSIGIVFKPTASGARAGTLTITDNAPGSPQSVALSGQGADFSLSASPTSASVSPGGSASFTISVTPAGGFNQAVTLSCASGLPALASCSFTPASVTPNGTAATATLTVSTTAGSSALPRFSTRRAPPQAGPKPPLWLGVLLVWLAYVGWRLKRSGIRRVWLLWGTVLLLAALAASCGGGGGGGGSPGTPAGTYTISVSGSGSGLSHNTQVTLTVQ
jgi:hypothetical protein